MPTVRVDDGVNIYYEESGQGLPVVFVHEFAGDYRSWHLQMRFFSRRYRAIAFNARGYPPSDVPDEVKAYSQERAAEDIRGVLDGLKIQKAHICGLSMGGFSTLHFGLRHPDRALSLVVAGAGYGSVPGERDKFRKDTEVVARRFEEDGMMKTAAMYSKGPTRVQFMDKDPFGWREFHAMLAEGSAKGHALTQRGVQMLRPSILDLGPQLEKLDVPTLIMFSPACESACRASRRCWPSSTLRTPCSSGICSNPRSCWPATGVNVKRFSEVMMTAPGMAGRVAASLHSR